MARIIYGIISEGMGHAMRSRPVIDHLRREKKNKIKIFSSGRAYDYLRKKYDDVNKIQGVYIKYKNNKVSEFRTVLNSIITFPKVIKHIIKLMKVIDRFKPDLIITDYEPTTSYAGFFKGVPVMTLDNQHIFDKTKLSSKKHFFNYLETRIVDKLMVPYANYFLIPTFFYPKVKSKNTFLFPPILRKEIRKIKTSKKGHIFVYQTSDTNKRLIKVLKQMDHKFIVYGFNKSETDGNLIFREFNDKEFYRDFSECNAVITNGGFTLMTEAIYLCKPILSIPIERQFEQITNAIYLEKYGYGKFIRQANKKDIIEFIKNISQYEKTLKMKKMEDNSKLFKKIDSIISKLAR